MRNIQVGENAEAGETTFAVTFDNRNAEEMADLVMFAEVSRDMCVPNTRMHLEAEAWLAYFKVVEAGVRRGGERRVGFETRSD